MSSYSVKNERTKGVFFMERIASQEERIRRAEEIYFNRRLERRRAEPIPQREKKKTSSMLLKKMLLQIGISFLIYFMVYLVKGNEYAFSSQVLQGMNQFLNHELDWGQTWQVVQEKVLAFHEKVNSFGMQEQKEEEIIPPAEEVEPPVEEKQEAETEVETKPPEEVIEAEPVPEAVEENGVGGGTEESQDTNLSQMELDAKFVKENYTIQLPLQGRISSPFGARTPTDIVSANHCGTDIAAITGTEIRSIMDGTVTMVSEIGDYGKHIKIENGEISVLYAHCNELDVTEGQEIKIGDVVAKVGSTGKATGPHLHIEIKRADRYIDPEMILPF